MLVAMKRKAAMKSKKVVIKRLRALESDNDKLVRQRLARAQARLFETEDQLMYRQEQDKTYKAKQRSLESEHETRTRQTLDKTCKAQKRAMEYGSETIDHISASSLDAHH